MVEYLKTKKGYFYKLLKNGEKKRISEKEYNRKNKKMIGGRGKSEQEIIDELKKEGKYDEWVKSSGYFGIIDNSSNRQFTWTDINGKRVIVSGVTKTYEEKPRIEYIAVFEFCNPINNSPPTHNSPIVKQNNYSIVDKNIILSTRGLATCSALLMIIGNKKFMAHIDANTDLVPIVEEIDGVIKKQKIDPKSLKAYIYAGDGHSFRTEDMAKTICRRLDIPKNKIYTMYADSMNLIEF
jgi:hypothetical protein